MPTEREREKRSERHAQRERESGSKKREQEILITKYTYFQIKVGKFYSKNILIEIGKKQFLLIEVQLNFN